MKQRGTCEMKVLEVDGIAYDRDIVVDNDRDDNERDDKGGEDGRDDEGQNCGFGDEETEGNEGIGSERDENKMNEGGGVGDDRNENDERGWDDDRDFDRMVTGMTREKMNEMRKIAETLCQRGSDRVEEWESI